MFGFPEIQADSKVEFYKQLATQASHLLTGEDNEIANLSNIAALLDIHLKDVNWAGFYLWYPSTQELILGPFCGLPACVRIAIGRGVCGSAARDRQTLLVPDVNVFPGHIACDSASNSEVVIPLLKDGQLVGVLDIDSPLLARFDEEDARGFEKLCAVITHTTNFQVNQR
jgi:L-methionine (R)-S-oxide reductase